MLGVGRQAVGLLMQPASLQDLPGRPRHRRAPNVATAGDLFDRCFHRDQPDRLGVTDITEHPTREGKLYCAVVLVDRLHTHRSARDQRLRSHSG